MCLLLPIAVFALDRHDELLPRLDLALYDRWLPPREAVSSDVLIIGIDDRSLHELGPWPWSRAVHARLLDRIAPAAPRSVMFDLFLETPGNADDKLQAAMKQVPVYLPVRQNAPTPLTPMEDSGFVHLAPQIARGVHDFGHARAPSDIDNVIRRMYRYEGPPHALKPYVGMLIADGLPSTDHKPRAGSASTRPDGWSTQSAFGVAIAGPDGTYPTVSYASVLRGEVPPELLRGRDLLVGAMIGSGLHDRVTVMVDGRPQWLSHVELQANAIDALRHGRTVSLSCIWSRAAWIALPIWLALVLFLRMPRYALAVALLLCMSCIALSAALLTFERIWLAPAASLVGIAVAYLLWSWRRLDALHSFFGQRVAQLNAIPSGAFEFAPASGTPPTDAIDRQTAALDHAIVRLTHLQSLLSEGLWQLPLAVLVCRADGTIGQSNAAACRLLLRGPRSAYAMDSDPLAGANLLEMLARMGRDDGLDATPRAAVVSSWPDVDDREYVTAHGREFRVKVAAIVGAPSNWMVVLRDMSAQYRSERERDQWLGFLSHDLRSPQVSILSLLALYAGRAQGMDETQLVEGVRREAQRTLTLAEGLIDVTEALSNDYRFERIELGSVVLDAIDQATPYAAVRQVVLVAPTPGAHDCPVCADGQLLQRALLNVLNNAIRHSPPGGTVRICIEASLDEKPMGVIAVQDEGDGMDAGSLARWRTLPRQQHQRRWRDRPVDAEPVQRRGLGLSLVHAVVERHGGWVDAQSAPQTGTTLLIGLPLRP